MINFKLKQAAQNYLTTTKAPTFVGAICEMIVGPTSVKQEINWKRIRADMAHKNRYSVG